MTKARITACSNFFCRWWINNFHLKKISYLEKSLKEAPNFQLATGVSSLKLPVRGLVITIQHGNIVRLVTRSLDDSLGQSRRKIVRKSIGSNPMRDSFLALRDSCRDWFPILFFPARGLQIYSTKVCRKAICRTVGKSIPIQMYV